MTAVTTGAIPNDTSFEDAEKLTKDLGAALGNGAASNARLARAIIKWAQEGVISTKPNTHGKGVDDVAHLFDIFAKACSRKQGEHAKNGLTASASKLRQPAKLGEMTTVDGTDVVNRGLAKRAEAFKVDPKAVLDEYKAIVAIAREQLKNSDHPLTDDELAAVVAKPAPATKETEEMWEAVLKSVQKIVTGENKHGVKDQSDEACAIEEAIRAYHTGLMALREKNELLAKAKELGLEVSEQQVAA